MSSLLAVKEVWQQADAVCFDVDSTVISNEGLDELAHYCGVGPQVADWTKRAMGGAISFRIALQERLNIVKPSREQVENFIRDNPLQLTMNVAQLIQELHKRDVKVFLVSGGFRSLIEPVAKTLNIPTENIFANSLHFTFNGEYAGFDHEEPTSKSGGKPYVIRKLKEKFGFQNLVMIGDGATDMEACPPADAFIGFGGNVVREAVKKNAQWFVSDFQTLISSLEEADSGISETSHSEEMDEDHL